MRRRSATSASWARSMAFSLTSMRSRAAVQSFADTIGGGVIAALVIRTSTVDDQITQRTGSGLQEADDLVGLREDRSGQRASALGAVAQDAVDVARVLHQPLHLRADRAEL